MVNKNVAFLHFVNCRPMLFTDCYSVFYGDFKVGYVLYVTMQGDFHRC